MLSKKQVWELFQNVYFNSVDSGEMTKAISIFHEDVEWIHTQVWEHDEYKRSKGSDILKGKKAIEILLQERSKKMEKVKIRHSIQDMVFQDSKGAFIGFVEGPGKKLPIIAWFEVKDDKISRYIVTPLYIPNTP